MTDGISDFVFEIEALVGKKNVSYMDAILLICEQKNIEPETFATIVTGDPVLMAKISAEADSLNFLKKSQKTHRKSLPI